MRRREFITLIGGAAAGCPFAGWAQQAMPVVGFLNGESPDRYARFAAAFRQGLGETGYIDGRNVTIEYQWAEGHYDRLQALVTELIAHKVTVIVACGGDGSTFAARAATTTIPIIFLMGSDPTKYGVVASYNKPGGNLTGVTLMLNDFMPKRLEVLLELLPHAKLVSFMTNPNSPTSGTQGEELGVAAIAKGLRLAVVAKAGSQAELTEAYAKFSEEKVDAVIIDADSCYQSNRADCSTCSALQVANDVLFARLHHAGWSDKLRYISHRHLSATWYLLRSNLERDQAVRPSCVTANKI